MSPYTSLGEECAATSVIVEHCHKGEGGIMQYRTCADRQVRLVKCQKPKTKCVEFYNVDEKTDAQCVDPTNRPSFPETGSISWNGTEIHDSSNWYWRPRIGPSERTAIISGRTWKDDSGNFYQKERKVHRWLDDNKPALMKTEYVFIKPYGNRKFAMYKAVELDQPREYEKKHRCTQRTIKSEGSLSSLWQQFKWYSRYFLEDLKQVDIKLRRQTWVEKILSEEWDSRATWIMDYDSEKDSAVPVRSKFVYNDDDGRETVERKYSYQSLDDDLKIRMPWYCKGRST